MRLGSSNPAFKKILNNEYSGDYAVATYKGVAKKTFYFIAMTILGALGGIALLVAAPAIGLGALIFSAITTGIFAIIALLVPSATKVCGTIYCLAEGFLVGVVSIVYNAVLNGAVVGALVSTIVVFLVVATMYLTNLVKVNGKFIKFLMTFAISAMLSIFVIYLIYAIQGIEMSMGVYSLVSVISCLIATLYLFFDMEQIKRVVEGGYPEQTEWMAAFGLAYTLIWIYIEMLRLIAIFSRNNN